MKPQPITLLAAVVLLPLASCSLFAPKKTVSNQLPTDRENIAGTHAYQKYTPEELRKGVVKGDWAIESVYGKKAVGQEAPFIKFVPEEKRIYGNNGCNVINAGYTYNAVDSTITFDHVLSTMMLCNKEGITDYEINTALGAAKYYSWRIEDNDYYLTLLNEAREPLMVMMHQNFQFLNGTWRVAAINGETVNVEGMKLVFDIDEGHLHGNTGCNILNGNLDVDMDKPNSISFSAIGQTRMACQEGQQYETALLVALEEVSAARPLSGHEVILYDSQHKPVLTLVRTDDRN